MDINYFALVLFGILPSVLITLGLLKNTKLNLIDKIIFGICTSMMLPAFILFLTSLIGISYSYELAFVINAGLLLLSCFITGIPKLNLQLPDLLSKKSLPYVILVLIMVFALWARMQSLSTTFYEFDPYYYIFTTQYILTQGSIPIHDFTAWFPQGGGHRLAPVSNYLEANWYSLSQGTTFNQDMLTVVSNIYPPIVGMLICFLVFIIIREMYTTKVGLVAAGLAAVLPLLIQKFAAGEAEIQPYGIFALMFFIAAYVLLVNRKDVKFAILSAIAAISVIAGSQYFIVLSLVYGAYLGVRATLDFIKKEDTKEFLIHNGIIVGTILATAIIMSTYVPGYPLITRVAVVLLPYLFAVALWVAGNKFVKEQKDRIKVLEYVSIAFVVLLFITPLAGMIKDYVMTAVGFAGTSEALFMTVAEEAPTMGQLSGAFDILGYQILPGISFIHLVLAATALVLGYNAYKGSKVAILLLLLIFPISFIGIMKSKYLLQLGLMLILSIGILLGELERRMKDKKLVNTIIVAFLAITLLEPNLATMRFDGAVPNLIQVSVGNYFTNDTVDCAKMQNDGLETPTYLYCSKLPAYWTQTMDFIKYNTTNDSRIVSWWDYGHWINYFGERDCLTRNDHTNTTLDLMVANEYVNASPESLSQFMQTYNSTYAVFDVDLIQKWGALNFLSCVDNNETNMTYAKTYGIGSSNCEKEHSPEYIFVPESSTSSISDYCTNGMIRVQSTLGEKYCMNTTNGVMVYQDNMTKQNRAIPVSPQLTQANGKQYVVYMLLYFKDSSVWQDGISGWADRKGKFYDSNFYSAFFLGQLDGFTKVFDNSQVKIYKNVGMSMSG